VAKSGKFEAAYMGTPDKQMIQDHDMQLPAGYDPTARPWYKDNVNATGTVMTAPYIDMSTKKLVISFVQPVQKNGALAGVLGILKLTQLGGGGQVAVMPVPDPGGGKRGLQSLRVGPGVLGASHAATLSHIEQHADPALVQAVQKRRGIEAVDPDRPQLVHQRSPLPAWLPAPTVTGAGSRGRSGDRGAFQLDHLAGDRQSCHAEHGGGRRYLGCSQPRRQHSVVLEEQVDVGGVHVEPHEVGQ